MTRSETHAQHRGNRPASDQWFRWATTLFAIALSLHAADHLRRGMDVIAPAVMVAGMVQIGAATITVILVFQRNRWAPHAAITVGVASAIGFSAAHLLPTWGMFSDSHINAAPTADVTWFSWVTAIVEITADIVFAAAAIAALRSRRTPLPRLPANDAPADSNNAASGSRGLGNRGSSRAHPGSAESALDS